MAVRVSTSEIGTDDILIKLALKGDIPQDFEKKLKRSYSEPACAWLLP
jgi:hypothetical protein